MVASAAISRFSSFLSPPRTEVAAPAPATIPVPPAEDARPVDGPYNYETNTLDMTFFTGRHADGDDGYTPWAVIDGIMQGDTARTAGVFPDVRILDPWAGEAGRDVNQLFTVTALEAEIGIDWRIVLTDANGEFAKVEALSLSYDQLRHWAHAAVSKRLGAVGDWHAAMSTISSGDMVFLIEAGRRADESED
jgi:hypothetical protein